MRVVVTGTPGTGKTTATERLDADVDVTHLNKIIEGKDLYEDRDADRDSVIADLDAVRERLDGREGVIESHLAHRLPADRAVVLRCHPDDLESRLRERGNPPEKARENAESETLDVVLSEAVAEHGPERVYEIDTTDRSPGDVAREIDRVIAGEREPSAGEVSFLGE